jgi:tRNA(fMet)-specific endonuclease VapC
MYLLDSNILIYWLKDLGQVSNRIRACAPHQIKVPAPALFELEYGTAKSKRPTAQRDFIDKVILRLEVMPLDYECAKTAGQLRGALEVQGNVIGPYDLLIAGIALSNKLTVITRNTREFSRVPGLKVENWYD